MDTSVNVVWWAGIVRRTPKPLPVSVYHGIFSRNRNKRGQGRQSINQKKYTEGFDLDLRLFISYPSDHLDLLENSRKTKVSYLDNM